MAHLLEHGALQLPPPAVLVQSSPGAGFLEKYHISPLLLF